MLLLAPDFSLPQPKLLQIFGDDGLAARKTLPLTLISFFTLPFNIINKS